MKTEEQIQQDIKNQKALCDSKKLIHFAPDNGKCFRCGSNIYQDFRANGRNGAEYITGCPHCHYSFCD